MTTPLCSIIIPTYNHGKFIDRSISSALDQTYPNIEVIVVDDGSTDDTPERMIAYGDRITYFRKENTGRGDNRNQAIKRCKGEYIQFLDADDTIDKKKVAIHVQYLATHPDIAVVYSGCTATDRDGVVGPNTSYPLSDDENALKILLSRTLCGIHAGVTRRSVIMDVGMFDVDPLAQEDWDLWLKIALKGYRYKYLPGDLAHYDGAGSTTVTNSLLMYRRYENMLQKYLSDHDFISRGSEIVSDFKAHQSLQLASRAYNNGWWKDAQRHFMIAAAANPRLLRTSEWLCLAKAFVRKFANRSSVPRV